MKIRIDKKEIIAKVEGKITNFYKWKKKTIIKLLKRQKGRRRKNNKCCLVSQAIVKGFNFRYFFILLQYL